MFVYKSSQFHINNHEVKCKRKYFTTKEVFKNVLILLLSIPEVHELWVIIKFLLGRN